MIPTNPLAAIERNIGELLPQLEMLESDFYDTAPAKASLKKAVASMRAMRKVISNPFAQQSEAPPEPDRSSEDLAKAGRRLCDLLESVTGCPSDNSPNSAAWRGAIQDMRITLDRIEHESAAPAAPAITTPSNGVPTPARRQHKATDGIC